jgi:transcriptional regulator with XRE-family HTH domain
MLVKQAVGSVLRERRAHLGLRLADVAATANVSMQYLSELERGRKEASSEVLDAVASALRLRPSTIMLEVATRLEPVAPVVELAPRGAELLAA